MPVLEGDTEQHPSRSWRWKDEGRVARIALILAPFLAVAAGVIAARLMNWPPTRLENVTRKKRWHSKEKAAWRR